MGFLIDLDGIDGSGGETQKIKLRDYLKSIKKNPSILSYPNYDSPLGGKIRDFLDKKIELTSEEQFYMFAIDMLKDNYKILGAIKDSRIVIRESGPNRTCAYQCSLGFPIKKAISFQKKVQKIADLVIFMDIPSEESLKRKIKDNETLDRFEENKNFQNNVRNTYLDLMKTKELGKKYIKIDGTKSIKEVHKDIVEEVNKLIKHS